MKDNVCIFQKITHDRTGKDLDVGYLESGTYIETLELDGPKLILSYTDNENYIKNTLQIKEKDTLTVSFGDPFREDGVQEKDQFTVLTCTPMGPTKVKIQAMATKVFKLKQISDKSKIFSKRGILDIIQSIVTSLLSGGGLSFDFCKMPITQDYQFLAGERPSSTLRQMASEQGALVWYARGGMHMKKFSELIAQSPSITFTHGNIESENGILIYKKPSSQIADEEKSTRTFTGWDEKKGRVKTSADSPFLSGASSKPTSMTASPSPFVLGNAPVAKQTAIEFVGFGNMSITAGQVAKIRWLTPDPKNPINEGLPDKIVVEEVAHWYSAQKYYVRVRGAVALKPTA